MKTLLKSVVRPRFVRFITVGAGANLLLLVLAYLFRRWGMPAFAAGAVGYAVAFTFAYAAQRNWTFGSTYSHRHTLPRYFVAQLGCAVAAGFVGHLCVEFLAAPPLWMALAVTVTAGATSYLLSSFWVFAGAGTSTR